MTENEAIFKLKRPPHEVWKYGMADLGWNNAVEFAISSLEEIKQYRAIGTVEQLTDMKQDYAEALSDWRQYRKIGTVEECRRARERQRQRVKKPVEYEDKSARLLASNMENGGGWISCEVMLPEEPGEYLCTLWSGEVMVCEYGWNCTKTNKDFFRGRCAIRVIAWQMFPEPYIG